MPRERSTWNREEISKRAAHAKKADPYLMNQDHVKQQPAADAYVTGTPSTFAEDVHPSAGTWEAEYGGDGQVKRNEIGMPEFRGDTFNHPEKTASAEHLTKKASLCVHIARAMLPKNASETDVEEQSLAFMHLADADVMATYARLAQDQGQQDQGQEQQKKQAQDQGQQDQGQEQQKKQAQQDQGQQDQGQSQQKQAQDQGQQDQGQEQQKQAGQMPPQFRENAEKKKEEAEAKKKEEGQGQQKEAQDQLAQMQQQIAQMQQQFAQGQPQVGQQQQLAQMQQQIAQMIQQAQQQQQQVQANQQQVAQQQQVSQLVQQAMQQGMDPAAAAIQAAQQMMAQGQQTQACGQQVPGMEDQLIDQMLAADGGIAAPQATSEMEIELEGSSMDVSETPLGPQDEILKSLFATAEQDQGQQQDQGQSKQAFTTRSASTRTVGTRPTQGVSQIGGRSVAPATNDTNKLSSLWGSSPDVSEAFGLPNR